MQIDADECAKLAAYIRGFNRNPKFPQLFHSTDSQENGPVTSKFSIKAPDPEDKHNPNQNWRIIIESKRNNEVSKASAYINAGEIYNLLWLFDLTITGAMKYEAESKEARFSSKNTDQNL